MTRRAPTLVPLVAACALIGCGARTGLFAIDDVEGVDAGAAGAAETCDGTDEDLDGRVDEDLPPLACGDGACAREAPSCRAGVPQTCPPVSMAEETCNRVDDDCDGRIDEGLGFAPLGPPIVIRDLEDERTGDCSRCDEVLDMQLVTFGRELYGVWHVFIAGTPDVPNTFLRRLADDGTPIEPSRPLFGALTTRVALAPSHSGRTIASYCERRADGFDYPGSQFLDAHGNALGIALRRGDADVRCASPTNVLWTGERHVFARFHGELSIETADADGRSLDLVTLGAPWSGSRNQGFELPFDGERVTAFAVTERSGDVTALEMDALGAIAERPLAERLPGIGPDEGWGPTPAVLADEHGVLAALSRFRNTGMSRADTERFLELRRYLSDERRLLPLATIPLVVEGPTQLLRRGPDELLAVTARLDRTVARQPQVEVQRLTGEGEPLAEWILESPGDDGIRAVSVRPHLGRVLVAYVRALDYGEARVELLELGCTP